MSEYPKCHHGFNDPNGECKQCDLESDLELLQAKLNKAEVQCEIYRQETHRWSENAQKDKRQIEIYHDAFNLILRADPNLGVSYAKGVAESALGIRHTMKASQDDMDTCEKCGLNFRNPIHIRTEECK